MKLNFWQWLGVILLVIATGLWINRKLQERKVAEFGTPPPGYVEPPPDEEPSTEPSTAPATAPAP